jgi:hypothetical protein
MVFLIDQVVIRAGDRGRGKLERGDGQAGEENMGDGMYIQLMVIS